MGNPGRIEYEAIVPPEAGLLIFDPFRIGRSLCAASQLFMFDPFGIASYQHVGKNMAINA